MEKNVPEQINSDQNRFKQVLLNLCSNSLKFTQKGQIQIQVYLIEKNLIKISVSDTGCGIPKKYIKTLCESFGKPNFMFNTIGAGLGLSISNTLAMGLGGNRKLETESVEGKGSIFSFYVLNREQSKRTCKLSKSQDFYKWISLSTSQQFMSQNGTTYIDQTSPSITISPKFKNYLEKKRI
ncbi:hypothetical protein IMG5_125740 [Ichthyophthirius multifiliis]|uniref:Histidine kinase domain-containing protein n=1 Tax=Ichthyophthirius multifiliis TaxID=5932 RepID=G0QVR6_ICHMU|nr:hypothetical protein IMG5_125740 [Ichthyophthirius multifiliis]EGR30683.1 hypothetical protein IMG5_125740 [Ichthyophthirius multifiliis]|eukprot:XP_004032270.1 hypothetical protein IMG5_125740 [Ichthyophthirius multifiliis]